MNATRSLLFRSCARIMHVGKELQLLLSRSNICLRRIRILALILFIGRLIFAACQLEHVTWFWVKGVASCSQGSWYFIVFLCYGDLCPQNCFCLVFFCFVVCWLRPLLITQKRRPTTKYLDFFFKNVLEVMNSLPYWINL